MEAAPTPTLRRLLIERVGRQRYLGFDLGLDARQVDLYADLTRLPFADSSVRFLICFHVLEHVPADEAAMGEISRVIADGGLALVMNPWSRHTKTEEDPEASEQERTRRFGQADHVRLYGHDFEDRLRRAGVHVQRFQPSLIMEPALVFRANLSKEPLWILTRAGPAGDAVRKRLSSLLPPVGPLPRSLLATRTAPVLVAAFDEEQLIATHQSLHGIAGLALVRDDGLLDELRRQLAQLEQATDARRHFAIEQLAGFDAAVRSYLGLDDLTRWGEVLTGLDSQAGQRLTELVLRRCPDAQLVHVVNGGPTTATETGLRAVGLAAGPRRYLEVPIDALVTDETSARIERFLRPAVP